MPNQTRLRIRFTKCGDVRWISHRDLARVWERLLRRAGLQLAFSQGFHPKPRISFPSALALGIEALDEVVELEVLGFVELQSIDAVLRREMPAGMELLELQALKTSLGKAKVLGASYRIAHGLPSSAAEDTTPTATCVPTLAKLPASETDDGAAGHIITACVHSVSELQCRLDAIRQLSSLDLDREGKTVSCPTDDSHFDLSVEQDYFLFSIPNVAQGSIRPSELLAYVGLGHLLEAGVTLQRTAVHLQEPAQPPHST